MPIDRPTARELIESAAEHLAVKVRPALPGHGGFEALVAANLLAIALRELELGAELREADRLALASLLDRDQSLDELELQLTQLIRDGWFDDRADELQSVLRASARRRLRVANPGYVREEA
jgi:hypothetical protein